MNALTGKKPLAELREFNGLWIRGSGYACPVDHLTDCYNCIFPGKGQVTIRESYTTQSIGHGSVISFTIVEVLGGAALLVLNTLGEFWDETHSTLLDSFPIGTVDDFSALCIFGRAYITLKFKGKGASGQSLRYYDGTSLKYVGDNGNAPVLANTFGAPGAGSVDPGTHKVYYAYVSPTGYVTKLSPVATIVTTGTQTIEITGIPNNPFGAGNNKILFITRANELEPFFIPNGTIAWNTATFSYNGFDSSLIVSGDYLNNILGSVGSCAALKFYKGRMIAIGRIGSPDDILVSDNNSPETFNIVNNIVKIPADYGINTASGGMVIRSVLYVTKPNGSYVIQDNGGNPNTWGVDIADSGLGAFDVGISSFASSMSAQDVLDSCLLVNRRGLLYFNGAYHDPPLTYKIQYIWDKLDPSFFYKVQIAHDVWNKRVYIAVPLDNTSGIGSPIRRSTDNENRFLLMMDYSEGLTPMAVKWSIWNGFIPIKKITVENFTLNYTDATMIYQLAFAIGNTTIYKLTPPTLTLPQSQLPDDSGGGVLQTIQQAIITAPIQTNGTIIFSGLNFTFSEGMGDLNIGLWSRRRDIGPVNQRTLRLNAYGGIDLQRLINFTAEGMQVQLIADLSKPSGLQGYFWLTGLDVYGTVMYNMRPALSESF